MTVELQPAASKALSLESSEIGFLSPERDNSPIPVGVFNGPTKPAAGVSFLLISQFFILTAFIVMGVLFWLANSWVLPLYESLHLYLFWPLGCCVLMISSVGIICRGVGRHDIDPVRSRVGSLAMALFCIFDLVLFYAVLLRTFSLAWSFLDRNTYFLVLGFVWIAICSLLFVAVPVISHLPVLRFMVNVWANRRIRKWLDSEAKKDSKKSYPDLKTEFDSVDKYASMALIRHCERKLRAWIFRRPSDHLLRFLQCDANNSAARYENWWALVKWTHFKHIFSSGMPIPQKTESNESSGAGSILKTLLHDLYRSQSNLMLYSCLYEKFPTRVRGHIYSHPLFVCAVKIIFAFEQLIQQEMLHFWADDLQIKLACLDHSDSRPWAFKIINECAPRFSLEGPFQDYINQLVKWLTDGGLDNPDVELLVREGKSIIADAFPWTALYERIHDENNGKVGKTLLEGHFSPYVLFLPARMRGRKSLKDLRAVAPIIALRVAVQGAYSLWLARLAVKSPALALKVYREVGQDLRQNGGLEKVGFLYGTRAHRIYGDVLMFYSTRMHRVNDEMHFFTPILMDDAEDAYAMAGAPEDMKNVRDIAMRMREETS